MKTKTSFTLKELMEMPHNEVQFLWGQIIPQVGITFLTGSSDCNKSTFLRQLCLSIGIGDEDFLGLPLKPRKRKAIYVSTEDDATALSPMLKKQIFENYDDESKNNIMFIFDHQDILKLLEETLLKYPADAVIIDTWTDTFSGDLNQSTVVRKNLDGFGMLAKKYNCAFIMVHHKKKGTDDKTSNKSDMLGSQGIEAKARSVIELKREGEVNKRVLQVLKGNYTPDSVKSQKKVFIIDENFRFSHVKDTVAISHNNKTVERNIKDKIRSRLLEEKNRDAKQSFKTIHEHLNKEFGDKMVSITTLKNWFKGKGG